MRLLRILTAAALLLLPTVVAHTPPGPKNFCEQWSDLAQHDYWTSGAFATVPDHGGAGQAWLYLHSNAVYGDAAPNHLTGPWDGNLATDCNADTVPADYDRHKEFAIGGAVLAADNGGVYASGTWTGASWGSQACLGEDADHTPQTTITVTDAATGGAVGVSVTADYARDAVPADAGPDHIRGTGDDTICGDHVIEPCGAGGINQVTCNVNDKGIDCPPLPIGTPSNSCTPGFNAGQNGAYEVLVWSSANAAHPGSATTGHILN